MKPCRSNPSSQLRRGNNLPVSPSAAPTSRTTNQRSAPSQGSLSLKVLLLSFFRSLLLNIISTTSNPLNSREPTNGFCCHHQYSLRRSRSLIFGRNRASLSIRVCPSRSSFHDGR